MIISALIEAGEVRRSTRRVLVHGNPFSIVIIVSSNYDELPVSRVYSTAISESSKLWETSTLRMFTVQGETDQILTRRSTHHTKPVLLSLESYPLLTRGRLWATSNRGDSFCIALRKLLLWQSPMAQISCTGSDKDSQTHRMQGPRKGYVWQRHTGGREVYRFYLCRDCRLPLT